MDEPICRAAVEAQTYRTDFWTQLGKERVGRIESRMEAHTSPCVKEPMGIQCMMQGAQASAQDELEGWDGEGLGGVSGGRGHRDTCVCFMLMWQKPAQ